MILSDRLQERSRILQAVRSFFITREYLEVDTPIRLPVPLPESHIKPFAAEEWFLHSSPEQCMKRLLAHGCSRLFQVCHCFRKEEMGRYHQGEFAMLEWYRVGWSYRELMDECEQFLQHLVQSVPGLKVGRTGDTLLRDGREISLRIPWQRLTVAEAFRKFADISVQEAMERDMFEEILVTMIEPNLGWETPVFLLDYPVQLGSLARQKKNDPSIAERFELYVGGIELANGFSELTDPGEQRRRFAAEMEKAKGLENAYPAMPEKFLADLGNLSDTAGIALGLDRLFMILLGCATVKEVMCMVAEDL